MVQAVRGSCPLPASPLRPGSRPAAARQSPRGTRAAAHPAEEGPPGLRDSLQNLDQALRAPRINRAEALLKLETISQEAARLAARRDSAVARRDAVLAAEQAREERDELQLQARARCRCTVLCFKLEEWQ
jgi:hypothetical protein